MVFCNIEPPKNHLKHLPVTILILIDGFLQYAKRRIYRQICPSHNPYFNRWFSAIEKFKMEEKQNQSHNPYFNRWFSAIQDVWSEKEKEIMSQSLF